MTEPLPLPHGTMPMWSYAESLGIDPNSLVEAFANVERDPSQSLRQLQAVRHAADQIEARAVSQLRDVGTTWDKVALLLGVSRVQAMRRHAPTLPHPRRVDAGR